MNLLDRLKNLAFNLAGKYSSDSEAVVISCFFNPQKSPYRRWAFDIFYQSIKHLDHLIAECVIGDGAPELPASPFIRRVSAKNLLWHKESLLNLLVRELPAKYKYVFWVDADCLFSNRDWLTEGVRQLQVNNLVQPFEYCVHLEPQELRPSFDLARWKQTVSDPHLRHPQLWRGFAANYATTNLAADADYDRHGHVGFAWGARREILAQVPLYDKALIGGADHIIAHAAAGHIPHPCITKAFAEDSEQINDWSKNFYRAVQGKIGYVPGDLYHLWHGPLEKRQYFRRIREFAPAARHIKNRDRNGLYETPDGADSRYMTSYFAEREIGAAAAAAVFNSFESFGGEDAQTVNSTEASNLADANDWQGFGGGGDFAGAGAGGSWDAPNPDVNSAAPDYSGTFS